MGDSTLACRERESEKATTGTGMGESSELRAQRMRMRMNLGVEHLVRGSSSFRGAGFIIVREADRRSPATQNSGKLAALLGWIWFGWLDKASHH